MKNILKFLLVPFLLALCFVLSDEVTAQAAETSDGVYYPSLLYEVDWGEYEGYKNHVINDFKYFVCLRNPDVEDVKNCTTIWIFNNTKEVLWRGDIGLYIDQLLYMYVSYVDGVCTVRYYEEKDKNNLVYADAGNLVPIGSNYDYRGSYTNYDFPYSNMCHPLEDEVPDSYTSVSVVVDGTEYTIEEPYPYYFLSNGYDHIRLYFSEMPFTATPFDKWLKLIPNTDFPKVVSYEWDSSSEVGFLESRTVYDSGDSFIYNTSADYACNYTLYYTGSFGEIALLPKDTYPDVYELYAALPDELTAYTYFIILRQTHENAVTSDVVFYGWNDANADLIIRWGDSMIAAAKKGTVVSDSIKARYDLASKSWAVDSSVSIGLCNYSTYNVPYIYYSNSDLFIQQSGQTGWYSSGMCAYMADLDAPNIWFEEEAPEEVTGIEWLDGLLGGLGNLFSRLFVPSSSFIQQKVTNLTTRFSFWRSVVDTVNVFVTFLSETDFTEPPQVSLNLGNAISKYDYGTSAYFVDFTWYEPYKPDVDALVSAVLWVVFVWNTFKNLPNSIRGVSGGLVSTASHLGTKEGE